MAINKLNFSTGSIVTPTSGIEKAGDIINKYYAGLEESRKAAEKKAWEDKIRGRQEAEWARQDTEREATRKYMQTMIGPEQRIAGGVTDAALQAYNGEGKTLSDNIYGSIELNPRELAISRGAKLNGVTQEERDIVDRKILAQQNFGRELMANAPMETQLMKADRAMLEAGIPTDKILELYSNTRAADLAAKQSKEKSIDDQKADLTKKINDLRIDIAKERGGGLSKKGSSSDSKGGGTKGMTYQDMLKSKDEWDVSPQMFGLTPDVLKMDENTGVKMVEAVVKTIADKTGKNPNQIREIAANELGNVFNPGTWGNNFNLGTKEGQAAYANAVYDRLNSSNGSKYNSKYVAELEKQLKDAESTKSLLDTKRAGIYADPIKARIDAAADIYKGLLNEAKVEFKPNTPKDESVNVGTNSGIKNTNSSIKAVGGDYTNKVSNLESKGDYKAVNNVSGALGKYQMLPSTLNDYREKLGNKDLTDEEFLNSPELQDKAFAMHTKVVQTHLEKNGIPVNDWTTWVGHNLGQGNAVKLFNGDIDDGVKKAIARNLPGGVEPTVANYNKRYKNAILGNTTKKVMEGKGFSIDEVKTEDNLPKENTRLATLDKYSKEKASQQDDGNRSALNRTLNLGGFYNVDDGEYADILNSSKSESRGISLLSNRLRKQGFDTPAKVQELYNSMPDGDNKDAVYEVLNYKMMQNSEDWRDAKKTEQYVDAGLAAASAIPGAGPAVAKIVGSYFAKNAAKNAAMKTAKEAGEKAIRKASAEAKRAATKRSQKMADGNKAWEKKALHEERSGGNKKVFDTKQTAKAEDVELNNILGDLRNIGDKKGKLTANDEIAILNALEKMQGMEYNNMLTILNNVKFGPKVEKYIWETIRKGNL